MSAAVPLYGTAIFLGAFLLFVVQPLLGKFILPWFGGSPAVWAACLLFFQVMLLAGYAYAFALARWLPGRAGVIVHMLVLAGALAALPITPSVRWLDLSVPPWARIVLMLAASVGLPYAALAATSPLLQAWLSRVRGGAATYRLYALSNLGSLLALVGYPLAIEPLLTRAWQSWGWSAGMAVFAVICAACGAFLVRPKRWQNAMESADCAGRESEPAAFAWILWLLLPAASSALLMATTNVICQDVAPMPLLWIVPLGLYLLSFILCFDQPDFWYRRGLIIPCLFVVTAALVIGMYFSQSFAQIVIFHSAAMFLGCMVLHGELARLRPHPRQLTAYYLAIAAGGAAGGALVAIAAPGIFSWFAELPLCHMAVWVTALAALWRGRGSKDRRARPIWLWLIIVMCATVLGGALWIGTRDILRGEEPVARYRNFYGVVSVYDRRPVNGDRMVLIHNGTTHGEQVFADPARPTSYYTAASGVGRAVTALPAEFPRRIGVVGLGAGTMAAWGRAGDDVVFYEINPLVERVAREQFTFLADSPARVQVVLGDARLTMAEQAPQRFDLLVLDAFTGDAIPVHLLTREAFALYLRHMVEGGIIAVHISNQHLDLEPVVRRCAHEFGLAARTMHNDVDEDQAVSASTWMLLARSDAVLQTVEPSTSDARPAGDWSRVPLWTDDYSSLLKVLK